MRDPVQHGKAHNHAVASCCAPSAQHEVPAQPQNPPIFQGAAVTTASPTISLPGGTFLMGTDYANAFAADGEGPIRPVTLSPFRIDTYPVTNRDFAAFINATSYRTESELFAWSFVFWMHLPPDHLDELVEDTVAAALVVQSPRRILATSRRPRLSRPRRRERPPQSPRRPRLLELRLRLCHMGWQISSHRSPVGVRRTRWPRTKALPVGR